MASFPPSQVKGIWFVSALEYAREVHGEDVVKRIVATTPARYRDIYESPISSAWYPEEAFEIGLIVAYDVVAQGSDFMFEQIVEGCTEKGVNKLFRMLLRASSPSFVLRRVPTMWKQIRRGAGHVEVQQQLGRSLVRYSEFPWFRNPLYRMLTVASLRSLVRYCNGRSPRIEIAHQSASTLDVQIDYRALESDVPTVSFASTRPAAPQLAAALAPQSMVMRTASARPAAEVASRRRTTPPPRPALPPSPGGAARAGTVRPTRSSG